MLGSDGGGMGQDAPSGTDGDGTADGSGQGGGGGSGQGDGTQHGVAHWQISLAVLEWDCSLRFAVLFVLVSS